VTSFPLAFPIWLPEVCTGGEAPAGHVVGTARPKAGPYFQCKETGRSRDEWADFPQSHNIFRKSHKQILTAFCGISTDANEVDISPKKQVYKLF